MLTPVIAATPGVQPPVGTKTFDVICAGEFNWKVARAGGPFWKIHRGARLRPGGGPANVAVALASQGLRVGLATVLADDALGREWYERSAASGIDLDGVILAAPRTTMVLVDGDDGACSEAFVAEEEPPIELPSGWTSRVLVLSGLSPVISHAAALCKAARAAKRSGALVVIDFNAGFRAWAGHDAATIQMVLQEVDVARCSPADLAVLGMDVDATRKALRRDAVLVLGSGTMGAVATGPFGEVGYVPPGSSRHREIGGGHAFTAALCATLLRRAPPGESPNALWRRALQRGYVAANAHVRAADVTYR
ncbi:MAG: carbohydrate kinase family protein [Polyangiales bacterium]